MENNIITVLPVVTIDWKDKEVYASSLDVAELFGKQHSHVMRDIRSLLDYTDENAPKVCEERGQSKSGLSSEDALDDVNNDYYQAMLVDIRQHFHFGYRKNSQNKRQPMFWMTQEGFEQLTLGFSGKRAKIYRHVYVKEFHRLKEKVAARNFLGGGYNELRASISEYYTTQGREAESHHYIHFAELVNRLAFGRTSAELKEELGDDYRNNLTPEQNKAITRLQKILSSLIDLGKNYQECKAILAEKAKTYVTWIIPVTKTVQAGETR
jgi:Rha family phage regulatory protein